MCTERKKVMRETLITFLLSYLHTIHTKKQSQQTAFYIFRNLANHSSTSHTFDVIDRFRHRRCIGTGCQV